MAKNLVLYFSVYGTAKKVAEEIAQREDIFVTTKLWPTSYNTSGVDAALKRLGLDYVDLMLLHQPMGDAGKPHLHSRLLQRRSHSGEHRQLRF